MQSMTDQFQKTGELPLSVEPCISQQKKAISVTIKTLIGQRFQVSADPADPIRLLKLQIEQIEGMEQRLQKLVLAGKELRNDKTLGHYQLKEGTLIYLMKRGSKEKKYDHLDSEEEDDDDDEDDSDEDCDDDQIPVDIIYNKKPVFTIMVNRTDSILDVKAKIMQNVESDNLRLRYNGRDVEDDKTVADYKYFKSLMLNIYGNIKLNVVPEFSINVCCQQVPYKLIVRSTMTVKDLRVMVSGLVGYLFILLCNGKILSNENASLDFYGITKTEDIIVIPESTGGNCLKFMLAIEGVVTNGIEQLRKSLNFLEDQQTLDEIFMKGLDLINGMSNYKNYKPEELLAVRLWTSNILYKQLDDCLVNNKNFTCWGVFLKNFMKGLKHMNYYEGKAYRGVKDLQNIENFKKGTKISWKSISGLTKNQDEATGVAGSKGTVFEIDVISAKDVSRLSASHLEQLVLLPYSCFEVVDVVSAPDQPLLIQLREIPIPRAPKVLFWVDDNPAHNHHYAKRVEQRGTSVVFCTSTRDALDVIESYKWLLSLDSSNFRIVSDMVRYEDRVPRYTAGIELLKALFNDYHYQFPVMIFCNDVKGAQESANKALLKGEYYIKNKDSELEKFINF